MRVWVATTPTQRLSGVFSSKENVLQWWKDCFEDLCDGKRLKVVDGTFGVVPELRLMNIEPFEPVALAYEVEVDEYYTNKEKNNDK